MTQIPQIEGSVPPRIFANGAALPVETEDLERMIAEGWKSGWVSKFKKTDPRSMLLEYQARWMMDQSRFKIGLMSRQVGKDYSTQCEMVESCYRKPRTQWVVAAPGERQALSSLSQGKDWARAFDLAIADYVERRDNSSETLLKSATIQFANGSWIRAVPGKPETVRGESANITITEFDFLDNPGATWRAMLPSITNPLRGGLKRVRLITTPNGAGSAAHKIWTKGSGSEMTWSKHLVTIYHAVLMGLPVNIAELKEAFDDPDGWAQEYECRFLDGSNVLLPYDVIALGESAEATEVWDGWDETGGNPVFLGIDFGRTNDPTVCWAFERVGDVLWTREVLVLKAVDSPDQEAILKSRIKRAARVCFDYTGPGIGLGDYLVKEHKRWRPEAHEYGKVELCTFTPAFKRLIFPRLRKAFQAPSKIRVPISTMIREDLHEMRQVISKAEYNYWSPRTSQGHSDRCTAAALAVRAGEAATGRFVAELIGDEG